MGDTISTGFDAVTDNKRYYNCPNCGRRVWAYGAFVGHPCIDGCESSSQKAAQQRADDLRKEREKKVNELAQKLQEQKESQDNEVTEAKSQMNSGKFDQAYWDKSREKRNENNPFYQFKALDMKNTMTDICDEINQHMLISDGINKCMDNIEDNLKKSLKADIKLFKDGINQYRKYADDIKLDFKSSYGDWDTEVKNDEEYENDSDASDYDEDDCMQNHLKEFPKKLNGLSNRIKTAKEAFENILRDYKVFIKACDDAEKQLDEQMKEVPASIIKIAKNLKTLYKANGITNNLVLGAVIGGITGGIIGGVAGGVGGGPIAAVAGGAFGAVFGAIIGGVIGSCIASIKMDKIDRSKTKNALEKLGKSIQDMINERATEYSEKKVIAKEDEKNIKERIKELGKMEQTIYDVTTTYKSIKGNMKGANENALKALRKKIQGLENHMNVISKSEFAKTDKI